jgi:arginine deiminase
MTCDKGNGQFKCEGCSQTFCIKHVVEHRQTLNQQLNEVILEHDTLQQAIHENKNHRKFLMTYIEQWEQKSIDKIRQMAKEARQKVTQLADTHKSEFRKFHFFSYEYITYRTNSVSRIRKSYSTNKNST